MTQRKKNIYQNKTGFSAQTGGGCTWAQMMSGFSPSEADTI
jgi:hypothetical protein